MGKKQAAQGISLSLHKVFVSSTIYDLIDARAEVEQLLRELRLIPVMSGSSTSGFQPVQDKHSIESCLVCEVVQRRGQARFRENVLAAYGGKCAIPQCDAVDALEAAHILPFSGPTTDYAANGLLLRADLHTLFDLDLLGIDPSSHTVKMASRLLKSSYGSMNGVSLTLPGRAADRPNKSALFKRWQQFKSQG